MAEFERSASAARSEPIQVPPAGAAARQRPETPTGGVLDLQRKLGNRSVVSMLQGGSPAAGLPARILRWSVPPTPPVRAIDYKPNGTELENGKQTPRPSEVNAVVDKSDVWKGAPPGTAWPLGWSWAAKVPVPGKSSIKGKPIKPHEGWVRFHLLSEAVGGMNHLANLVPTNHLWNSNTGWRTFEDDQYDAIALHNKLVAVRILVGHHPNAQSTPPQPGDNEIGKFPSSIDGEWWIWDASQSAWVSQPSVHLKPPAPSPVPGNIIFSLPHLSIDTMVSVLGLNPYVAEWIAMEGVAIAVKQPATAQALYKILDERAWTQGLGFNKSEYYQALLKKQWSKLDNLLNKPNGSGTVVRIFDGWLPNGKYAIPAAAPAPATPATTGPPKPAPKRSFDLMDTLAAMDGYDNFGKKTKTTK